MDIQQKWESLCDAWKNEQWSDVETAARDLKQELSTGAIPPTIAKRDDLGRACDSAIADAVIDFMLSRFESAT